jgi:aryl sulfotransferase
VNYTRRAFHEGDSHDHSIPQDDSLRHIYDYLCEMRAASTRGLRARLSAAGFGDISEDGLLLLQAMHAGGPATRGLLRRLGITSQGSSESLEELIRRGFLELRDDPDKPRQPLVVHTRQGLAVLREIGVGVSADRWAELPFRSDDIIISTPKKSGTTWMQMICALLIFQTTSLPAALPELSPWLDEEDTIRAEIYARLAAQQHRRFMKTHMPLNEILNDSRITYIVVARNPLDTSVSMNHQNEILALGNTVGNTPGSTPGSTTAPQSDHKESGFKSSRQFLLHHIDEMGTSRSYFDQMLRHLSVAWERRTEPNVVLMHYEDLSADLAGEMRRLAEHLGIAVPEAKWPSLVHAATFKQMREAADQIRPLRNLRNEHAAFFRKGSSGDGRALLTSDEAARYYDRARQVASQELLTWLHRNTDD